MSDVLRLVAFALPPSFPPELVPEPGRAFVRACVPGLSRAQLLARTRRLGWKPAWTRLPQFDRRGIEAYAFSLTIDGVDVPLVARMQRTAKDMAPPVPPARDGRQLDLFS